jgi:hypothetical protein
VGATISGGGATNYSGDFSPNSVASDYATIAGGLRNVIQISAGGAVIGGGDENTIQTNAAAATISGGSGNTIEKNVLWGTIGGGTDNAIHGTESLSGGQTISGGSHNSILDYSAGATIGGGYENIIQPAGAHSIIGGGLQNMIQTNALAATIGGGRFNTIQTNTHFTTIGGGACNTNFGSNATISGGVFNRAYGESDAIGGGSNNLANGVCVSLGGGCDNKAFGVASSIGGGSNNVVLADFATVAGGAANWAAGTYSFAAGHRAIASYDGAFVWADSTGADLASTRANSVTMRASGGYRFFSDSAAAVGVSLAPGGNAFSPMSDRDVKENFRSVDPRRILEKVAALPVSEWNLVSQHPSIRHLGPMAQDFRAAFGLGEDDRHISTSDADGVALAALKGLNEKLEAELKARDAEIQELRQSVAELRNLITR